MRNFPTSEAKSQAFSGRRIVLLDVVTASHEVTLVQNAYKWRQVGDILVDVGPRLEGITVHTQLADKTAAVERWYQAAHRPYEDPLWESLAREAGWE